MDAGRFRGNLEKLLSLAEEAGLDAVVLAGKANVEYATGLREPSGALVASRNCGATLLVSLLDYDRLSVQAPRWLEVKAFYRGGEEGIEPPLPRGSLVRGSLLEAVAEVLKGCGARRVGVDLDWAPRRVSEQLAGKAGVEVSDFSDGVRRARRVKEDWEVEAIVEAARLAESTLRRLLGELSEDSTEARLAGLAHMHILSLGGWGEAFPTIVAFHENTAYPHHTPTTRRLGDSGAVLIDLGARLGVYRSDMTRSLWWGGGGQRYTRLVEAVVHALEEALDTVEPGVAAWEVDRAARASLEREGLAKYFIHGLGHGVGVEIHEEPYLRPGSKAVLEPGNVVTIEPGVYLTGVYGVRVEDMVLVTGKGRRLITSMTRLIL
ncbi:aminopeptidase P family protein [Stetteria hydrogenophila]